MILVYLLIFAVILYCSESKQIKRYLQKGGVEPAVAVGGIIVFAVVVGLLIWFLTRDKSSPTPAPTTKPSHRRHHHGHVGSPPSDTPPHGGTATPSQTPPTGGTATPSQTPPTGGTMTPSQTPPTGGTMKPGGGVNPNVIKTRGVTPPSSKTAAFVSDNDLRIKASKIPNANKIIPKPTVDAATQKECAKYFENHGDFCKGAMDRQKNMKRSGGICTKQCLDFLTQVHKFFADPSEKCHNFVISILASTRGLLEFYTRKSEQDVKICKSLPVNSDGLQK